MAELQFIFPVCTSRVSGKKLKLNATTRNKIANVSTVLEYLPMLQRAGGRGSPRQRFRRTQEMEIMYEESSEAVPRERMALNATEDAMLMSERRQTIMKLMQSEFRGTMKRLST